MLMTPICDGLGRLGRAALRIGAAWAKKSPAQVAIDRDAIMLDGSNRVGGALGDRGLSTSELMPQQTLANAGTGSFI